MHGARLFSACVHAGGGGLGCGVQGVLTLLTQVIQELNERVCNQTR